MGRGNFTIEQTVFDGIALSAGTHRFVIRTLPYTIVGLQWHQKVPGGSATAINVYATALCLANLSTIPNPPADLPWRQIPEPNAPIFSEVPDGTVKASLVTHFKCNAFSGILVEFDVAVAIPSLSLYMTGRSD